MVLIFRRHAPGGLEFDFLDDDRSCIVTNIVTGDDHDYEFCNTPVMTANGEGYLSHSDRLWISAQIKAYRDSEPLLRQLAEREADTYHEYCQSRASGCLVPQGVIKTPGPLENNHQWYRYSPSGAAHPDQLDFCFWYCSRCGLETKIRKGGNPELIGCEGSTPQGVPDSSTPTPTPTPTKPNIIDHPAHYSPGTHEVFRCLVSWGLHTDAMLWDAVVYIARCKKKGSELDDLKKAQFWLARKIEMLEGVDHTVPHASW